MKSKIYKTAIIILAIAGIFAMASCKASDDKEGASNKKEQSEENTGDKYIFTDSTGAKVEVQKNPGKVAVLYASYADLWQLAGGKVSITIQGSVDRGFVKEDDVTIVGDSAGKTIDSEALIASQPDFVILTTDLSGQLELVDLLRKNNIPVAAMTEDSFEDYLNLLKIFTDITGDREAYETYGTGLEAEINDIKKKIQESDNVQPEVLLIRAYSTGAKAKVDDNFVGVMLKELGCDNIADHGNILLEELSTEAIVAENPKYVFVTTMGNDTDAAVKYMEDLIESSDAWQTIDAIKNNNYYVLSKELFHYKPNARWAEAYRELAKILYPDLF